MSPPRRQKSCLFDVALVSLPRIPSTLCTLMTWRWCKTRRRHEASQPGRISPSDAVRPGRTQRSHPIQDVAREACFGLAPARRSGAQAAADDRFTPEEGVLNPGLLVVTRLLLPSSTSECPHALDRSIAETGPWPASRDGGRLRRRDHDGRASGTGRCVERDSVIGGIRSHAGDVSVQFPT